MGMGSPPLKCSNPPLHDPGQHDVGTGWERVGQKPPSPCHREHGFTVLQITETNEVKPSPSGQNDKKKSASLDMKNSHTSRNLLQKVTSITRYSEILSTRLCNPAPGEPCSQTASVKASRKTVLSFFLVIKSL